MDAEKRFCTTCEGVMHEVSLLEVAPSAVSFLTEFLQEKGMKADLTSGWWKCENCGGYVNIPAVEALRQKYFV